MKKIYRFARVVYNPDEDAFDVLIYVGYDSCPTSTEFDLDSRYYCVAQYEDYNSLFNKNCISYTIISKLAQLENLNYEISFLYRNEF